MLLEHVLQNVSSNDTYQHSRYRGEKQRVVSTLRGTPAPDKGEAIVTSQKRVAPRLAPAPLVLGTATKSMRMRLPGGTGTSVSRTNLSEKTR